MRIVVEMIAARLVGDEVRYECAERESKGSIDPNETANADLASRFPGLVLDDAVVHSTSWRYDEDHIVLTYLGYSEHLEPKALTHHFPVANVKDPEEGPDSVAAHAVRHLAFLVREDPSDYEDKLRPATLKALAKVAPDVAGRRDLKGVA
jgi:hypothetical protein